MRFETHVEIGTHARKSNEGLYAVQSTPKGELTLEEVTRAARRLGFGLRPWTVRQQNPRGFSNNSPARNRNGGEQEKAPVNGIFHRKGPPWMPFETIITLRAAI